MRAHLGGTQVEEVGEQGVGGLNRLEGREVVLLQVDRERVARVMRDRRGC